MSAAPGRSGGSPFSTSAALGLVLAGALVFLAALYFVGSGQDGGGNSPGGSHGGGKGLDGYAGLAELLKSGGHQVETVRNKISLEERNLLILTPPHDADGEELAAIVSARRHTGPTLIVAPKWQALPANLIPGVKARPGWVILSSAQPPRWSGFQDDIAVRVGPIKGTPAWRGAGLAGSLPDRERVLSGSGKALEPLVTAADGSVLAAYVNDGGIHPELEEMAGTTEDRLGEDDTLYPLVFVFEPDLLNNYGMADRSRAMLGERLIAATLHGEDIPIAFDLTLNGLGSSDNLLTLAFRPPFLAATLCLLIAALVIGWRAFHRFGPPVAEIPAIAFGKRQLAVNVASLIQRSKRFHLLGTPYAAIERSRVAQLLGIKPSAHAAPTEAEIDRLLAQRGIAEDSFTDNAEALRQAKGPHELLRRAHALKTIERKLAR